MALISKYFNQIHLHFNPIFHKYFQVPSYRFCYAQFSPFYLRFPSLGLWHCCSQNAHLDNSSLMRHVVVIALPCCHVFIFVFLSMDSVPAFCRKSVSSFSCLENPPESSVAFRIKDKIFSLTDEILPNLFFAYQLGSLNNIDFLLSQGTFHPLCVPHYPSANILGHMLVASAIYASTMNFGKYKLY